MLQRRLGFVFKFFMTHYGFTSSVGCVSSSVIESCPVFTHFKSVHILDFILLVSNLQQLIQISKLLKGFGNVLGVSSFFEIRIIVSQKVSFPYVKKSFERPLGKESCQGRIFYIPSFVFSRGEQLILRKVVQSLCHGLVYLFCYRSH